MSGAARRVVMAGVVSLVLLWPCVHLALVARAGIDPWEFFGWAMYSRPAGRLQIRVEVEREGELQPLRAMGELRESVGAYARSRKTLGAFASPAGLLGAVFESDAGIDAIVITLRNTQLDLDTAYLVARDETERFERPVAAY